jgi:serine/threonine protein phosphatase PrpC
MKTFGITEPPSKEFLEFALKKHQINIKDIKQKHPLEDFFLISKKYPIFVVADGVTLIQYLVDKKEYPNPSPAGEVARIFCESLIKSAGEKYESFQESDIKEIFKIANEEVRKYNKQQGRTKENSDFWDRDLFAATASFVVIKDDTAYWGSICDSYVAHIRNNKVLFRSPECNSRIETKSPVFEGDTNNTKEKTKFVWKNNRNGVNNKGKLIGYGVITGEESANLYLNSGSFKIEQGELVLILTDGFEEYLNSPDFLSVFEKWPEDLEKIFKEFTISKNLENPDKFGHERSLVAVLI